MSFDPTDLDDIIDAPRRPPVVNDWSDQASQLRDSLDRLQARMDDPELSGAELATLAREKRITLADLDGLGDGKAVGRVARMQQAVADNRLKLIEGGG